MKSSLHNYLVENSHLTLLERDIIIDCFQSLRLKKNQFWINKGDICTHIAFVSSGILRIVNDLNDMETTMQFVFKNSFTASLTSFVYQTPSLWGIQALTDCDLLIIDRDSHFKLTNDYKNWLEVDNMQLLLAYTELESRFYSQMHLSAEQRFNKLFSEKPWIFNEIPLKHIASSLGITPETLSRLRKRHLL